VRPVKSRMPCVGLGLAAVTGIIAAQYLHATVWLAAFAALCLGAAALARKSGWIFWLSVAIVFFTRHEIDWWQNPGRFPAELLAHGESIVHGTGVVTSDPAIAGYAFHRVHYRFEVQVSELEWKGQRARISIPMQIEWSGALPAWGDQVDFSGTITPTPKPKNPGEFDFSTYLSRNGIFAEIVCDDSDGNRATAHGMGNPIVAWGRETRQFLEKRLVQGIEDDTEAAGLILTVTLGMKEETAMAIRELFQHVGALHLFVVNGLHVALLAGILAFMLKPIGIYRRAFAAIIIPTLFAYALITGLNPGSVRAAIMAAVMFGATFVDREPFSFNTLAAAGLILLGWDTNELFQEGFQFSFGVVAAIILIAGRIERILEPIGSPDPFLPPKLWSNVDRVRTKIWKWICGLAAVSVAASVGAFPFSAGYFNLITPSGFFANIVLVPIAIGMLSEGIFSLLSSFWPAMQMLFTNANWCFSRLMLAVVHFFALTPAGYFHISTSSAARPEFRLTVLDLSPGQAIVLESNDKAWLIDCGTAASYLREVKPYLEWRGINHLDGLVLTRGASTSLGGAEQAVTDYSPREIVESSETDRSTTRKNLQTALGGEGMAKTLVESGDEVEMGDDVRCEVLYPPAGYQARTAADKSLILLLEHAGRRILLMSDSAFTGEQWLMDNAKDYRADIVIIDGESADLAGSSNFARSAGAKALIRGEPGYAAPEGEGRRWAGQVYKAGTQPFLQSETGGVVIDVSQTHLSVTATMNGESLH
jgi:competence protein ComEC